MRGRPILLGLSAGLVLAAVLALRTGEALGALASARATHAAVAAARTAPRQDSSLLRSDLTFPARDASTVIRQRVERLARGGGVLVEAIGPVAEPAPLVALSLQLSGPEKAVLALADAIERERPLLRFQRWRIQPAEGGGVRLRGVLVGAAQ